MTLEEFSRFEAEISAGVSFSSIFTALTTFFTGLIITNYSSFNVTIRIPILFLVISTLGFLYSTMIYANATGFLNGSIDKIKRTILLGDIISEYLGVYFLVAAIPLVINVITTDGFLRYAVLIANLFGLAIYHLSGFSIMGNDFKKSHGLLISLFFILEITLFLSQIYLNSIMAIIAAILIVFQLAVSYVSSKNSKRKETIV